MDMNRIAAAAIEAALDDGERPRRRRLTGPRAVAAGAALAVAARVAVKRTPVHRLADLSSVPDRLRDELHERGWLRDGADSDIDDEEFDDEDEDFEDEEPEAEADEIDDEPDEDEPEGEADDEPDEDDEPEAEDEPDEDEDDEPEADADDDEPDEDEPDEDDDDGREAPGLDFEGDGRDSEGDLPNVLELLSTRRTRPLMARARARVDPAARPPEPPQSDSQDEQSNTKRRKAGGD